MPTGYTQKLYNDETQTFEEFALDCARAFIYDCDVLPEEVKPSTQHAEERLEEAKATLREALNLTLPEAERRAQEEFARAVDEHQKYLAQTRAIERRARDMLDRVRQWEPPTEDHRALQDLMFEQLSVLLRNDANTYSIKSPTLLTGPEYIEQTITNASKDVTYYAKQIAEETSRAEKLDSWVKTLRANLSK